MLQSSGASDMFLSDAAEEVAGSPTRVSHYVTHLPQPSFKQQQRELVTGSRPRKLLRQLALQGELSEPEQLYRKRPATAWSLTHQAYRVEALENSGTCTCFEIRVVAQASERSMLVRAC